MNVFEFRDRLVADYGAYVTSFISIRDPRIQERVDRDLAEGLLWPEPSIGLNPSFAKGAWIDELVTQGVLHAECGRIFRIKRSKDDAGAGLRLHRHQLDAIHAARAGRNYVLTTGTGSGKSLAYIVPIVDHVLRGPRRPGIKAIVVYPMNALANSQEQELEKFLKFGYPDGRGPVTFRRYTGQENDDERQRDPRGPTGHPAHELRDARADPHAHRRAPLVKAAQGLRFLVLDELHTYRGRQGADVALLVRRTREACEADELQHVGTSATLAAGGSVDAQRREVARVASLLFGAPVEPGDVIGETLGRATPEPNLDDAAFRQALMQRLSSPASGDVSAPSYRRFRRRSALSLDREHVRPRHRGRHRPAGPRNAAPLERSPGAASELASPLAVDDGACARRTSSSSSWRALRVRHPDTGFPVFAFRLHQFISRGETVYASLEPEADRYLTLHAQQFVPGDRGRAPVPAGLLPRVRPGVLHAFGTSTMARAVGSSPARSPTSRIRRTVDSRVPLHLERRPALGRLRPEDLPDDWLESQATRPA